MVIAYLKGIAHEEYPVNYENGLFHSTAYYMSCVLCNERVYFHYRAPHEIIGYAQNCLCIAFFSASVYYSLKFQQLPSVLIEPWWV